MNVTVGQVFQPAGLPDFPVRWAKNGGRESRPNPQAGKSALIASRGSTSQCMKLGSGVNAQLFSVVHGLLTGCWQRLPGRFLGEGPP